MDERLEVSPLRACHRPIEGSEPSVAGLKPASLGAYLEAQAKAAKDYGLIKEEYLYRKDRAERILRWLRHALLQRVDAGSLEFDQSQFLKQQRQ